jgi:predicted DNA-binding transcriptional regulator YafY
MSETYYTKPQLKSRTAYRLLSLLSEQANEAGIVEMTQGEMASRLGVSDRTVARAINSLRSTGAICNLGYGIYSVRTKRSPLQDEAHSKSPAGVPSAVRTTAEDHHPPTLLATVARALLEALDASAAAGCCKKREDRRGSVV